MRGAAGALGLLLCCASLACRGSAESRADSGGAIDRGSADRGQAGDLARADWRTPFDARLRLDVGPDAAIDGRSRDAGRDATSVRDAGPLRASTWHWLAGGAGEDSASALARVPGALYLAAAYPKPFVRDGRTFGVAPGAGFGAVLLRLSDSGALSWVHELGGAGSWVAAMAAEPSGALLIGGQFSQRIELGANSLQAIGSSLGQPFVAALGSDGKPLWSRRLSAGPAVAWLSGETTAVARDAAGNSYVTGFFTGAVDLGAGVVTATKSGDVFVAKYDKAGGLVWGKVFSCDNRARALALALDVGGNVLIAGQVQGTINFGGTPLTGAGGGEVFLAKLDNGGAHVFSKHFGGSGASEATHLAIDAQGNIALAGVFNGTLNLGGRVLQRANYDDLFLASFDGQGQHRFSANYGGIQVERVNGLTVDSSGALYLLGRFSTPADFGTGVIAPASTLSLDLVLGKYRQSDGRAEWVTRLGGTGQEYGAGVVVDGATVYIAGGVSPGAELEGQPITTQGNADIFVARFAAQ